MASVAEALGLSLPGSASPASYDRRRDMYAHRSGEAVVNLLNKGITARQILTKEAFENAITVAMALGGSTNVVLHLLAIAHEAEVELTLDEGHALDMPLYVFIDFGIGQHLAAALDVQIQVVAHVTPADAAKARAMDCTLSRAVVMTYSSGPSARRRPVPG